jgi:beta-N-acetylhexosaminidase
MVMTAHINIPKLDDTQHTSIATGEKLHIPATLSHKIITKLLKEDMGFKGLVVSDAMDMKAIATHFGEIEATKVAIYAGVDVVLMPVRVWCEEDIYKLEKLFTTLEKEYIENKNFTKAVDTAYDNIIAYKKQHKLEKRLLYTHSLDEQIAFANKVVNCCKHKQVAFDIAKQSTSIIKNKGLIPFALKNNQKIVIVDSDEDRLKDFNNHLDTMSQSKNLTVEVISEAIENASDSLLKSADLVILVSANLREFSEIYSNLTAINPTKTINIAVINPYDNDYIDNIQNYVCIYGATSLDQTNYTKTSLNINIQAALENIFNN